MARTYIPSTVIQVHRLVKYISRYQALLRASIVAIDPSFGAVFDDLLAALLAFDSVSNTLYPLDD